MSFESEKAWIEARVARFHKKWKHMFHAFYWSGLPPEIEENIIPEPNSGCWLWLGSAVPHGYGRLRIRRQDDYTHRIVYRHLRGKIPKGFVLDHTCSNRICCNPDHLEPVTQGENVRRWTRTLTHCCNGHPFDLQNTRYLGNGVRQCRACDRDRQRARRLA